MSEPVNTNWGPGQVNTNLVSGPVNTNWGPAPVNTNLGPGPGAKQSAGGGGAGNANSHTLNKIKFLNNYTDSVRYAVRSGSSLSMKSKILGESPSEGAVRRCSTK